MKPPSLALFGNENQVANASPIGWGEGSNVIVFPCAATNRNLTLSIWRVFVKPGMQTSNPPDPSRTETRSLSICGGTGSCCRVLVGKAIAGGESPSISGFCAPGVTAPVIGTVPATVPVLKRKLGLHGSGRIQSGGISNSSEAEQVSFEGGSHTLFAQF